MLSDEEKKLVSTFISTIIGKYNYEIKEDLQKQIFREISRSVEFESTHRDIWGNWDWMFSEANTKGNLYIPWIDKQLLSNFPKTFKWPDNKPFALCLTHDVDIVKEKHFMNYYRALSRSAKYLLQNGFNNDSSLHLVKQFIKLILNVPKSIFSCLKKNDKKSADYYETWMELEDKYGFRSTFFFFPTHLLRPHPYDCLYHFQDKVVFAGKETTVAEMMKEIEKRGWEIGLHGSYCSATVPGILQYEKNQIEKVLGKPVVSTRQHWLHYDVRMTPVIQAEAGFKVDSTQGFNRSIGFRAGTSFPYFCWDHQKQKVLPILEIPQHIMDGALFKSNSLEYDQNMALRHAIQIMDEIESVGGCMTISWHPDYYIDPKWYGVYKELLKEAYRRNAWGCTSRQVYEWTQLNLA